MNLKFTYLFFLISSFLFSIQQANAQGATCSNPLSFNSVPFSYTGTTCGSGDDYSVNPNGSNMCTNSQSNALGGEDFVFAFTPLVTSCYDFTIPTGAPHLLSLIHI